MSPPPLTINNFLLTFQDFLIVWINQILYYNKIYDDFIYDKVNCFDLIVYKNRNPDLIKYLDDFTTNIINKLIINKNQENALNKIRCVIYDTNDNQNFVRCYNVNFHDFIVNLNDTIVQFPQEHDTSATISIPDINWIEVNNRYKTILFLHIQELKRLQLSGKDLFFKLLIDLDESVYADSDWVRLPANEQVNIKPVPVGHLELKLLNFDLHNEYN